MKIMKIVLLTTFALAAMALSASAENSANDDTKGPKLDFLYAKGSGDSGQPEFVAVAWAGPDTRTGLLAIINGNPECEGDFTYTDQSKGNGWFTCLDGSKGSFQFTINGNGKGSGRGMFRDQPFSFQLADTPFAAD